MLLRIAQTVESKFLKKEVSVFGTWRIMVPTLFVFMVSATVNIIGAMGGAFMYFPDSGMYVEPALILFHEGSFRGVSLFRVPGYPMVLAPLLGLFGSHATLAMVILQHALATVVSIFVVHIGNELDSTRRLGLIAGLVSAFSIEFQSFARVPMTEILYTFLLTGGFLYALRYLRSGCLRPFSVGVLLFSAATMVRPTGQYLTILLIAVPLAQALFPRWRFLAPDGAPKTWARAARHVATGVVIFGAIVSPWMFRNLAVYDHFGLSPTLGVNIFATVVESGKIIDETSPAIEEIKRNWREYQAGRAKRGEPLDTEYDWRHHLRALSATMAVTGAPLPEADKVLLQAAKDAIKAHPLAYAKLVARAVYVSLASTGASFLWVPGVEKGKPPPSYMRFAWPPILNEVPRESLTRIWARYTPREQNPFEWRAPTVFTPVYGFLMSEYLSLRQQHRLVLAMVAFGALISLFMMVKQQNVLWLAGFIYFFYTAVLPFFVVPASARYRIPADPIINVLMALSIIAAVVLVGQLLRLIVKSWRKTRIYRLEFALASQDRRRDARYGVLRGGDFFGIGAFRIWKHRAGDLALVRSVLFIVLVVHLGVVAWSTGSDVILLAFIAAFVIFAL